MMNPKTISSLSQKTKKHQIIPFEELEWGNVYENELISKKQSGFYTSLWYHLFFIWCSGVLLCQPQQCRQLHVSRPLVWIKVQMPSHVAAGVDRGELWRGTRFVCSHDVVIVLLGAALLRQGQLTMSLNKGHSGNHKRMFPKSRNTLAGASSRRIYS